MDIITKRQIIKYVKYLPTNKANSEENSHVWVDNIYNNIYKISTIILPVSC